MFYALQDYIGEDTLDAMLKQFLLDKGSSRRPTPHPRIHRTLCAKHAGPQWQGLLDRLLLRRSPCSTTACHRATAKKLPNGKYEVTMNVHAGKVYVDGNGKETAAKPDIPIEIGVFAAARRRRGKDGKPLYLRRCLSPTATARSPQSWMASRSRPASIRTTNWWIASATTTARR